MVSPLGHLLLRVNQATASRVTARYETKSTGHTRRLPSATFLLLRNASAPRRQVLNGPQIIVLRP